MAWAKQRTAWLETKNKANDVRGSTKSKSLPEDNMNAERRSVKHTMKSVQAPYERFQHYYSLEEAVDAYMEIWYEDSSDSD